MAVRDTSAFARAQSIYPFIYGADDVPALLEGLTHSDRATALAALRNFEANFFHQGVHYVEATPRFVPFLFSLLALDLPIAPEIIILLGQLYFTSYDETEADLPRVMTPHEPGPNETETRAAVAAGIDTLVPHLDNPSAEVRAAAVWVLTGVGRDPAPMRRRLEIEQDPRVRLSLHVALTGGLGLPPAPEPAGTFAADVLRVLTMTYPLDETTSAALTRVLLAEWVPTLHFVTGLPAQIASLQICRCGRDEPRLVPLLRAAYDAWFALPPSRDAAPDEPWHLNRGDVLVRLLRWIVLGDEPPRRPRDLSPDQRWVMEHLGSSRLRGVSIGVPEACAEFARGDAPLDQELTFDGETRPIAEHLLAAPEDRYAPMLLAALEQWPGDRVFGLAMSILSWHLGGGAQQRRWRSAVLRCCGPSVSEERALAYADAVGRRIQGDEAVFVLLPFITARRTPPLSLDPFVLAALNDGTTGADGARLDLEPFFVALPVERRRALLPSIRGSRRATYEVLCD